MTPSSYMGAPPLLRTTKSEIPIKWKVGFCSGRDSTCAWCRIGRVQRGTEQAGVSDQRDDPIRHDVPGISGDRRQAYRQPAVRQLCRVWYRRESLVGGRPRKQNDRPIRPTDLL